MHDSRALPVAARERGALQRRQEQLREVKMAEHVRAQLQIVSGGCERIHRRDVHRAVKFFGGYSETPVNSLQKKDNSRVVV